MPVRWHMLLIPHVLGLCPTTARDSPLEGCEPLCNMVLSWGAGWLHTRKQEATVVLVLPTQTDRVTAGIPSLHGPPFISDRHQIT